MKKQETKKVSYVAPRLEMIYLEAAPCSTACPVQE